MSPTNIEWTDETWNIFTGCTPISAGCDHCYAKVVAETRTREVYLKQPAVAPALSADPFAPRFWDDRLTQPLRWTRPRRIFVNSMSDVFHAHFTFLMIDRVFDVMEQAPRHTFQILTKRTARMQRYVYYRRNQTGRELPSHIWLGTSIEDMRVATRADMLRGTPAVVRFISAEPLIGSLKDLNLAGIHWVIAGGESGTGHRPIIAPWVRELRDKCTESNVAFHFKQWGGHTPKAGGRLLDGRTWDEYPQQAHDLYNVSGEVFGPVATEGDAA